jgi:hypothetical protein
MRARHWNQNGFLDFGRAGLPEELQVTSYEMDRTIGRDLRGNDVR